MTATLTRGRHVLPHQSQMTRRDLFAERLAREPSLPDRAVRRRYRHAGRGTRRNRHRRSFWPGRCLLARRRPAGRDLMPGAILYLLAVVAPLALLIRLTLP